MRGDQGRGAVVCPRTRAALVWLKQNNIKSPASAPVDFDRDTRGAGVSKGPKQHCCEVRVLMTDYWLAVCWCAGLGACDTVPAEPARQAEPGVQVHHHV